MTITTITVPASRVEVGHVVDNRTEELEVLAVEAFTNLGKNSYKISIGRNGQEVFTAELLEEHTLTYTYKEGK
jgi:hypothetical protein